MRSVHLELLTETTLELVAVVELKNLSCILNIPESSKGRVFARPPVIGDTMIAEA